MTLGYIDAAGKRGHAVIHQGQMLLFPAHTVVHRVTMSAMEIERDLRVAIEAFDASPAIRRCHEYVAAGCSIRSAC